MAKMTHAQKDRLIDDLRRRIQHLETRPAVVRENNNIEGMRELAKKYCAEHNVRVVDMPTLRKYAEARLAH